MNTSEYFNSPDRQALKKRLEDVEKRLEAARERLEAAGKRLEEWNNLPSLQAISYNGLKEVDSIMGEMYAAGDEIKQIKSELDAIEQG